MYDHGSIRDALTAPVRARRNLLGGLGLLLLGACSEASDESSWAESAIVKNGAKAELVITNDWGAGYCANVSITNETSQSAASYRVWVALNGGTVTSSWNYSGSVSGGVLTVSPVSWGAALAPGQTRADAGFCVSRSGTSTATVSDVGLYDASGNPIGGGGTGGASGGGTGGTASGGTTSGGTASGGTASGGSSSGGSSSGGSGGATCTARSSTYEAETMTRTTGGAVTGGWNLWSNGSLSATHTFADGSATIRVVAQGTAAQGVWPHFVVSVGGTTIGSGSANTTGWATYSFPFTATAGAKEVRVTFDNDYYSSSTGEDRNLIVDKVVVEDCASAGTGGSGGGGTGGTAGQGGGGTTGGTGGGGGTGACSATTTPVARHGRLRIQGNKFVNACGRPVTLHGMSMYDWSQQGRQFYNASAVQNLASQMKVTGLRIPILPANYPSAVSRVRTVVDACIANGIYAIIDWHSMEGANASTASAFFREMATAYGNTPNVMYEPWNEPVGESWSAIKSYHETVVSAIRAIDPDNVIILATPQWDQRPQDAAANPVTTSTNLAYTVHFYANTHSLSMFQSGINTALNKPLALFVTEYGGVSADGNGSFNEAETQRWWNFLDTNGIGSMNWAVETNPETSSVFVGNASATGPWPDSQLTNSGRIVFNYIKSTYAGTMAQ